MWNEPNLEFFLRGEKKARRYATLVKAAYPPAKAAAPDEAFLAGALAESDVRFARALYRAGVRGSFDGFSIHPYSHDVSPLSRRGPRYTEQSFARGVPAIRRLMLRAHDDKPLWLTEFGWSTVPTRGAPPWENGVDEARQARYVREALHKVGSWKYVPAIVYYAQRDRGASPTALIDHFGLVHVDGSPKPSLAAFRDAAG